MKNSLRFQLRKIKSLIDTIEQQKHWLLSYKNLFTLKKCSKLKTSLGYSVLRFKFGFLGLKTVTK